MQNMITHTHAKSCCWLTGGGLGGGLYTTKRFLCTFRIKMFKKHDYTYTCKKLLLVNGGGGGDWGGGAIHYKTFPLYVSYKNVLYLNTL